MNWRDGAADEGSGLREYAGAREQQEAGSGRGHYGGMRESPTPAGPVTLCVLLWARPGAESGLIAYEDQVLGIASGYAGQVLQRARSGGGDGQPLEIQLLEFPTAQAVAEFMADGRRQALAGERDRAIARTEVIDVQLVGGDPGA
jgi:hypothetical protein